MLWQVSPLYQRLKKTYKAGDFLGFIFFCSVKVIEELLALALSQWDKQV